MGRERLMKFAMTLSALHVGMLHFAAVALFSLRQLGSEGANAQEASSACSIPEPIYFEYSSFAGTDFQTLQISYDAYMDDTTKSMRLTRSNPSRTSPSGERHYRGQVFFKQPIQFAASGGKKSATSSETRRLLSFNTAFSFFLLSADAVHTAEGFVFFLMTDPSQDVESHGVPLYFGALPENNVTNAGLSTTIIAVEYDTTQNFEVNDVDNDHVGLDINSATSVVQMSAYRIGVIMSEGTTKYAWIDYFQFSRQLELRLSNSPARPDDPLLRYGIDLGDFYTDTMYVGFSAETRTEYPQTFAVKSWSFTTFLEPYTAYPTDSSPVTENPGNPPPGSGGDLTTWIHKSYVFGKIAGVAVGVALVLVLVCGGMLGFTHFGFSCVATQEDLIELEREIVGDFGGKEESRPSEVQRGQKSEDCKRAQQNDTAEKKSVACNAGNEGLPAGRGSGSKEEIKKNDEGNLSEEDEEGPIIKKGSLWGELIRPAPNAPAASDDDCQKRQSTFEAGRKESFVQRLCACGRGNNTCSKGKREGEDKETERGKNEKEQIVELIRQATLVAKDEQVEAYRFQWGELREATAGFSRERMLHNAPETRSSTYRGTLKDSKEVAVKVVTVENRPKSSVIRAEMTNISNLYHPNLIRFLGWCKKKKRIYIVYQRHHGESLDKVLFLSEERTKPVPWSKRFEIITTVANTLSYLHHDCRRPKCSGSLKFSSIMVANVDVDFDLKLVNYGLEWLQASPKATENCDKAKDDRYDKDRIEKIRKEAGTSVGPHQNGVELLLEPSLERSYGFVAPELRQTGRPTKYTDVYSFGMLSLEIACLENLEIDASGERNQIFIDSLHDMEKEDTLLRADFMSDVPKKERNQVELVLRLSLACIAYDPLKRPNMKQLVHCLDEQISLAEALQAEQENREKQGNVKEGNESELTEGDFGSSVSDGRKCSRVNARERDSSYGQSNASQMQAEHEKIYEGSEESNMHMTPTASDDNDKSRIHSSGKESQVGQGDELEATAAVQSLRKPGNEIKLYDNASFETFDESTRMNLARQGASNVTPSGEKVWVDIDLGRERCIPSLISDAKGSQGDEDRTAAGADSLGQSDNEPRASQALQTRESDASKGELAESSYFSQEERQSCSLKRHVCEHSSLSWQNECEYMFNQDTSSFQRLLSPAELPPNLQQKYVWEGHPPESGKRPSASFTHRLDSINDAEDQTEELTGFESLAGVWTEAEKEATQSDSYCIASLSWPPLPRYYGNRKRLSSQGERKENVHPTRPSRKPTMVTAQSSVDFENYVAMERGNPYGEEIPHEQDLDLEAQSPLPIWPIPPPGQSDDSTIWPIAPPYQINHDLLLSTSPWNEGTMNRAWGHSNIGPKSQRMMWPNSSRSHTRKPSKQSNDNQMWRVRVPRVCKEKYPRWPISSSSAQDDLSAHQPSSPPNVASSSETISELLSRGIPDA